MAHPSRRLITRKRLIAALRKLGCEPTNSSNIGYEYWRTKTGTVFSVPGGDRYLQDGEPALLYADAVELLQQIETVCEDTGEKPKRVNGGDHVGDLDRKDH